MMRWEKTLVYCGDTVKQVIQTIDSSSMQIALVVNSERKLLGTVTDGDIRRGLLRGRTMEDSVEDVMNANPLTIRKYEDQEEVLKMMRQRRIRQIPVLDDDGVVIGLESIDDLLEPEVKENWVVIMAGGLGTRLHPLTRDIPKPLLKIGNKPILEIILDNLRNYGLTKFYLSVNYKSEMIEEYFGDGSAWGIEIRYLREDKRLGTAGSLSLIPEKPTAPMIVMNGDLLTKVNFTQLLQFHHEQHALATLCVRDFEFQIPYGVVQVKHQKLKAFVEKPVERYFVNAGIYVLNPELLEDVPRNTYYDMPTLFESLLQSHRNTSVFPIREYWLDIGRMDDYNRAHGDFVEVFG